MDYPSLHLDHPPRKHYVLTNLSLTSLIINAYVNVFMVAMLCFFPHVFVEMIEKNMFHGYYIRMKKKFLEMIIKLSIFPILQMTCQLAIGLVISKIIGNRFEKTPVNTFFKVG